MFRITGAELTSVAVFSVTGELVYFSDKLNSGKVEVNLHTYPGGIYLISMFLKNNTRAVRKVVIF
ncbi:MAG: T9SS type A sorting domain-containing protein [Bacteroidales bacterium]|nr:T9SS type A sorting domain-containing protein [Bacteroidales bacterium]